MAKPKVKTGFGNYSDPALEVKAKLITSSMMADPVLFPAPHTELDAAVTATTDYSAALELAGQGKKADIAAKNDKKAALIVSLVELGTWVMQVAKGSRTVMVASNFDVTRDPENVTVLDNPVIKALTNGLNPGELKAVIGRVKGATAYVYQVSSTDPTLGDAVWESFNSTLTRYTFKNLESGKRYWVRVIAVGPYEQVAYSQVVNHIVL